MMKRFAFVAMALLLSVLPSKSQVPAFPQTLPSNTVVGRLGIGPGPTQAIPFSTLSTQLSAVIFQFVLDGSGVSIPPGLRGYLISPSACVIAQSELIASPSGSIVVNIWKTTFASFDGGATHPVAGDKITASAPPTISGGTKALDTTLTGWSKQVLPGDILAFNVDSAATVTLATLALTCQ